MSHLRLDDERDFLLARVLPEYGVSAPRSILRTH